MTYKHFKKPGGFQNLPFNSWVTLPWSPFKADANGKLESELYTRVEHNMNTGQMCTMRVRLVRRPFNGDPLNPTAYDECVLLGGLSEKVGCLRWHYQGPAEKGREYYWQVKMLNFTGPLINPQHVAARGLVGQSSATANTANLSSTTEVVWFTSGNVALQANRNYLVEVPEHLTDASGENAILEGRLRVAYDGETPVNTSALIPGALSRYISKNDAASSGVNCKGILSTHGQGAQSRVANIAYTLNRYAGSQTIQGIASATTPARMFITDIGSTVAAPDPVPPTVKLTTRYCDFWRR